MARIFTIGNIEIWVFANDHLPPHFHLITPDHEALVRIDDLTIMAGSIRPADRRRVWGCVVENREAIASAWTRLHPNFPA